jgi:hypothetical protein
VLQPGYYHQLEADSSDTRPDPAVLGWKATLLDLAQRLFNLRDGRPSSTPQRRHTSSSPRGACSPAARKMDGDGVCSAVATRDRIEFSLSFIGFLCLFLGPSCNFFIF